MSEQCGEHMHGCQHSHSIQCPCGCGAQFHMHDGGEHGECGCAEKFLMIADEAWKEVLKDKIKAKILEHKGQHLDELAEMVAKANGEKWKHKISAKTKCNEFKDNLKSFFSSCGE